MFNFLFKKRAKYMNVDIDPDEIFLDAHNSPSFNKDQFEGRIEKSVSEKSIAILSLGIFLIFIFLIYELFSIQVVKGEEFKELSESNRLRHSILFATRGNITDRNNNLVVWNEPQAEGDDFPKRVYTEKAGHSSILGYIKYPQKDKKGFYYEFDYKGVDGAEFLFDDILSGENGKRIIETDALAEKISENTIEYPVQGESVALSIDSDVQEKLYFSIEEIVNQVGFTGGGGVIMDIHTGEILALATYPEIDSMKMTNGDKDYLAEVNQDKRNPFLNRITQGLYTPGSIVKPYLALAALNEDVIDQYTNIVSTGELEVPNPYDPSNPTFFSDWKAHGSVDVRKALAVSSNIYFYVVGGGYKDIDGVGITKIEEYMRKFGFGEPVNGEVTSELSGTIPNPEWKAKNFDGDIWRLGDTYFTSIGQYGFQTTPIQAVRAVSAIANGGKVINPKIQKDSPVSVLREIDDVDQKYFEIVREGMRQAVTDGTASGLNIPGVSIAAKTGTAELGVSKANVNSWTTGFFPYENPKYAFVVVMEKGSRSNFIGGVAVARQLFDWMAINKPEYLSN